MEHFSKLLQKFYKSCEPEVTDWKQSTFPFGLGSFLVTFVPSLLSPSLNAWQASSSQLGCDAEQDHAGASSVILLYPR